MKKVHSIIIVLFFFCTSLWSQEIPLPSLSVGAKLGGNMSDYHYTENEYDVYNHSGQLNIFYGGFLKWRPTHRFGLLLDGQYRKVGTHLTWSDVDYTLTANYLDLRLQAILHLGREGNVVVPYIALGPNIGLVQGGEISYVSDYTPALTTPLTTGDYTRIDGGLYAGLGFDWSFYIGNLIMTFSLEAGYNLGLSNTFSSNDYSPSANILNPEYDAPLYSGKRLCHGPELAMRLAVPIDLKAKRKKTQVTDDEIVIQESPQEEPKRTKPHKHIDERYELRQCYTLAEVRDKVESGKDITGMRICLFNIQFDFDKTDIRPEAARTLNDLGALLRKFPEIRIKIHGHTDSLGSDDYNLDLSLRRAQSVRSYLVGLGVKGNRIECEGLGEHYPIDTNQTESGRFRNRRVEISFFVDEE